MIEILRKKAVHQAIRFAPVLAQFSQAYFGAKLKNPVFLVGCARSGTTMLATILGLHRDIANWSEANHIWDPKWYPWKPSVYGKWPLEYDPEAFTARWWAGACKRERQIIATFGAYQWFRGRSYFLNKSPFHTFRITYILRMFPDARFIHLIRDGRAVIYSHSRKLLSDGKLQEWPEAYRYRFSNSQDELLTWLASFWKQAISRVDKDNETLGLEARRRLLEIRYEDLCSNVQQSLDTVCAFLDVNPGLFSARLNRLTLRDQNAKWRQSLPEVLQRTITEIMEPVLNRKGYV